MQHDMDKWVETVDDLDLSDDHLKTFAQSFREIKDHDSTSDGILKTMN
jgi:hypothetical protein